MPRTLKALGVMVLLAILASAPAFALLTCPSPRAGGHSCCAAAGHMQCRMRSQRPCCALTPGSLSHGSEAQLPVVTPVQAPPAQSAVLAAAPPSGSQRADATEALDVREPNSPQSVLCTFLI